MLGVIALDPQQPESTDPIPEPADAQEAAGIVPEPDAVPEPDPGAGAAPAPDVPEIPEPVGPTPDPGPRASEPPPGPGPGPSGPPPGAGPKAAPKGRAKKPKPPSLTEQIRKTGRAAAALAMAHVDLAKEEASSIGREGGRFAGLVAAALGLVIMALLLAIIGTALFLGEWLFGSIGWGVLHGVLAFVSIAVACVLLGLAVDPIRIVRALAIAIVLGVLTSVVLGFHLLNQAYALIGSSLGLAVDPALRPLVVGLVLGAVVGLILGIILAIRASKPNWVAAIVGGILIGAIIGAFTSISFSVHVGIAIGIAVVYLAWAGLMALDVYRTGIDMETLKARFTPTQTIETSKETLEWLQKRMPRGNGS